MWIDISADRQQAIDRREAQFLGLAFLFLVLITGARWLAPAARSDSWADLPKLGAQGLWLLVWVGCAWLLHRVAARARPHRDPLLLPLGMLLAGWGIQVIWRLAPAFGIRQLGWFLLGTMGAAALLRMDPELRSLRRYRYLWTLGGLLLLLLTLFFGTHPSGGSPRLWLGCCGFYFQPSEPLRLLLVAFLASYLGDRMLLPLGKRLGLTPRAMIPLIAIWLISVLLLIAQRDLGTGMLVLAILAFLLYVATEDLQILAAAGFVGVAAGGVGYALFDVVRLRMSAWLDPWSDPLGGAYQIVQSLIAVAAGGVLGRGPGLGSPGFIPAGHTDFIFAVIAEEFGLIGAAGLIALMAVLISRGLRAAASQRDPFARLMAAGVSLSLGLQALLIIGGNLRLLPLVGVTLPFVSYGGSSLLTSFLSLGILISFSGGSMPQPKERRGLLHLQDFMHAGWMALLLSMIWWSVARGPQLVSRGDNPRRAVESRFAPRGAIFDSGGHPVAHTVGEPGGFERVYPFEEVAPVVGYDSPTYGQAGIEASMDRALRGLDTRSPLYAWWIQLLRGHPPPGRDVRLTMGLSYQRILMGALAGHRGAGVLLDASTGDILALATSPSFDPHKLEQSWDQLLVDESAPLLLRPTQAQYQPGTALTPFLLAWAMERGEVTLEEPAAGLLQPMLVESGELECVQRPQSIERATLAEALRWACPSPISELGKAMGVDAFRDLVQAFGFQGPVGVRLPEANPQALAPTLSTDPMALEAVGQGSLTVTPLQMTRAFAGLLAGGVLPPIRIVDAVRDPGGEWLILLPHGSALRPVGDEVASRLANALRRNEQEMIVFSGEALTGGGSLGWSFAAREIEGRLWVLGLALEDARGADSESLAEDIMVQVMSTLTLDPAPSAGYNARALLPNTALDRPADRCRKAARSAACV